MTKPQKCAQICAPRDILTELTPRPIQSIRCNVHLLLSRPGDLGGFWVLSWSTSLLCIVGKLSGGGPVEVAVGVGDTMNMQTMFI